MVNVIDTLSSVSVEVVSSSAVLTEVLCTVVIDAVCDVRVAGLTVSR